MNPIFFDTPAEFRTWLEEHHATADELWVGFYRKSTGLAGITWSQAVDEALCFGWIDGVRRRIDDRSYANRFTPRRRGSNWSLVNLRKVEQLTREGRMRPPGLRAFEARDPARTGVYLFEQQQNPHYRQRASHRQKASQEVMHVLLLAHRVVCCVKQHGDFHELGRLEVNGPKRQPATRAVDFPPQARHQHHQQQEQT